MAPDHVWIIRYEGGRFEIIVAQTKYRATENRTVLNGMVTEIIDLGEVTNLVSEEIRNV